MNAEELYALASDSPAGQAGIPMNFQHTAPRLIWKDGWLAEFWYYREDENGAVYEPQYVMTLRLPGGNLFGMETLEGSGNCLGPAPELDTQPYWDGLNDYLERCVQLLDKPDQEIYQTMEKRWEDTLPGPLRTWMSVRGLREGAGHLPEPSEDTVHIKDLPAYWRTRMEEALKSKDKAAYEAAKEQYARALADNRQ